MKSRIFLILTVMLFTSIQLSCKKDLSIVQIKWKEPIENPPIVHHPVMPTSPIPSYNATIITRTPILSWNCSDLLTYDIYFGEDNPPVTRVKTGLSVPRFAVSVLSASKTYYWKVVAKNNQGDSTIGPIWKFTTAGQTDIPCPGSETVSFNNEVYNTVQIGTQCWFKENLNIGSMIDGSQQQLDNGIVEKYCYDNDSANCSMYGGLYQWNEAMQYSTSIGVQGLCPSGWHIPTANDFYILIVSAENDGNVLKGMGQGTGAGSGTDNFGFSALFSGTRNKNGFFYSLGTSCSFLSSSINTNAGIILYNYKKDIDKSFLPNEVGMSVRCIKD